MDEASNEPIVDNFQFSLDTASFSSKDLNLQLQAMENRIQRIIDRVKFDSNIPIMQSILGAVHDKDEIDMLGKALVKIAPLIEQMNDIKTRKKIVEFAIQEPQWVAATFGDFSSDIDRLIEREENENN